MRLAPSIAQTELAMAIEQSATAVGASPRGGKALGPGTAAPDFSLLAAPDRRVSPRDFRGQPLILVFYPADFSPVCSDQLALYNEILPELRRFNAAVLGISVDSVWSHLAFARERKLQLALLADFQPKGAVSRAYGVYRAQDGISERALFVLDQGGVIRWSYVSPLEVNPGADGILSALESLPSREGRL
jgi:peroxiredoxin (alkyl hydroperoxide reductase subunit C)